MKRMNNVDHDVETNKSNIDESDSNECVCCNNGSRVVNACSADNIDDSNNSHESRNV